MEPRSFCEQVLQEYERQWSRAIGHAVRHPLRLKIARLETLCSEGLSAEQFEAWLDGARGSSDPGEVLLADQLQPLWVAAKASGVLPFTR